MLCILDVSQRGRQFSVSARYCESAGTLRYAAVVISGCSELIQAHKYQFSGTTADVLETQQSRMVLLHPRELVPLCNQRALGGEPLLRLMYRTTTIFCRQGLVTRLCSE